MSGCRYGFNGKENDNEVKGEGNQQDYGMRIYDGRVGRFLSVDPLTKKFAYYSSYQFAGNKPLLFIDLDGTETSIPSIQKFKYGDNVPLNTINVVNNAAINLVNGGIGLVNSALYTGYSVATKTPAQLRYELKGEFQEVGSSISTIAVKTYTYHTQTPWRQQIKDAGYQVVSAEAWEVPTTIGLGIAAGKLQLPKLGIAFRAGVATSEEYVFRFDTRSLSEIKKAGGFNPWGEDMDLMSHAQGISIKNKTSGYVSTSSSLNVALEFGENSELGGFIYKIAKPKKGIDVNLKLGQKSPFPWEAEVAVPGNIPVKKIKSVTPVGNN